MLFIDLNKKRVNQAHQDPDVVILKGATPELINSLTKLTLIEGVNVLPSNPRKVALAGNQPYREKVSREIPQSVFANSDSSYQTLYNKLSELLDPALAKRSKFVSASNCKCSTSKTLDKGIKSRHKLQQEVATSLTSHNEYVHELRLAVQNCTGMNSNSNYPTIANIKAALALYAYYGNDRSFSSTIGSSTIAKVAIASPDTIARLATDFSILRRIGVSTATRYFVTTQFERALIRVLNFPKYASLLATTDAIQDQVDALGSLK